MSTLTNGNSVTTNLLRKWLLFCMLPFFAIVISSGVGNAQGYNIVVSPSVVNVSPGGSFNVTLRLEALSGEVDGAELHVDFDNTKLQVTAISISAGTLLPNTLLPLDPVPTINANGHIQYAASTFSGFPTTSFDMVDVTFSVDAGAAAGPTPLTFTTVFPEQTDAIRSAISVLNSLVNGTVNITAACTPPTATITNTPTCNGQDFDLVLDAATGVAPFDLIIDGNTYNDINVGGTITTFTVPELSLWTPADQPADLDVNDGQDVTVGTKFESSVNGYIKGIRFYKGPSSTGTFRGKLYNFGTQAQLANATFVTTPSGWQEVLFSTPVQITAGTVYLAAVYSEDGYYSVTDEYHNAFVYTNGPLSSPSGDGGTTSSSNGLYIYDEAFPNNSFQNSGYFIDVVFSPSEFAIELTSVTGDDGCVASGTPLQTLNVTSTPCATLPVSLLSLSASAEGSNRIVVKWATANEQNNKGFEIMRSLDGSSNWQSVGFVNGAGDSYARKDYSFTDDNLIARRYFYQLKQIDFDGKYKYTAVVSANLSGKEGFSLEQNFPNPFKGNETTIRFSLPRRTQVQLIVYDMNGRVVKTLVNGVKDSGTHVVPFRETGLPSGVYFYRLQADGFTDVKKMTVK